MVMSPPVVAGSYQSRVARNRTLRLRNLDRLACSRLWRRAVAFGAVGQDVPNHDQPDFESRPERTTRPFRLADAPLQSDRNLDHAQAAIKGHQEHVGGEVVAPDDEIGKDSLECVLAYGAVGAA